MACGIPLQTTVAHCSLTVDDKKGPPRKKLHLDPLLTKEVHYSSLLFSLSIPLAAALSTLANHQSLKLVEGYNKSELTELFDRVLDLEDEVRSFLKHEDIAPHVQILRQLKYDNGIAEIVGSKMEKNTMWYVSFLKRNFSIAWEGSFNT